jgi:hypothetical protein
MPENSILSPVSLTSYFDNATGEARQANLFFYKAGTLDPITVYTDSALYIPHAQPVATTGWGRVPPTYVGEIPAPGYRVRTFDQYQTLIEDLDGLPGALPTVTSVEPIEVDQTGIAKTGDVKMKWVKTGFTEPGWIEITQGGTIGKPGSNASLMQHDDAHDLFVHLWQQDSDDHYHSTLKVIPSKGGSAEGDWTDLRQIEVPDCRGRFLAGLDAQILPATTPPSSTSGRLDKAVFAELPNLAGTKMTPWDLGGFGGESVHKLTKTELAVHFHDWIDAGGHSHYVDEGAAGHKHVLNDPEHTHGTVLTSPTDSNGVLVRTDSNDTYGINSDSNGGWAFGGLTTQPQNTGITMDYAKTNLALRNWWYVSAGYPGYGETMMHIGAYSKKPTTMPDPPVYGANDDKWHNKTEVYPIANDGSDGTDMGDRPHNTTPPFILFAIFMKL